jgi:Subtilase family
MSGPLRLAALVFAIWSAEASPPLSYSVASARERANTKAEVMPPHSTSDVSVVFYRGVSFDDAREAILAAGGSPALLATRFLPAQRIEATVPPSALEALAADPRVLAVAGRRRLRVGLDNAVSATLSHVNELYPAPYDLSGNGVVVSLFELGEAQATHLEFGGRLHIAPTTIGGASAARRHATHVAGTIGAAGVRADAKGMAPAVTMHQFCVPDPSGSNACEGDIFALKDEQLPPLQVVVDNNSWGYLLGWVDGEPPVWMGQDEYWGAYDLVYTAPLDAISNERGILFVHSAGNDGTTPVSLRFDPFQRHLHADADSEVIEDQYYCVSRNGSGSDCPAAPCNAGCEATAHHLATPFDTIGATASAKNVVSVGAISSANLAIASLSSRGPAKDGRVKPELVARGLGVLSTEPTDRYGAANGTSTAAPAVTGIAALLVEQWRRSYPGNDPTPAQLKALLIAGAQDLGNPGPDYTFGFGLVKAKASVDFIRDGRVRTLSLSQGETYELALAVDQTQDLRIVLNWSDPAIPYLGGSDVAEKALVNDLDVTVIDPAGNTILPWTLDKDHVNANAVRGVNTVDPIEMLEIAGATPGTYRVIVTGKSVPEGPQTAVVVASAHVVARFQPKRRATR